MTCFTHQSRLARHWAAVCIGCAVLSGVASAQRPVPNAFAEGEAAFGRGDYAAALAHFEQARATGSDGPAVLYNIGVSQYRLGRYAAAEATFRSIADGFPQMRDLALYNVALSLEGSGDVDGARAIFAALESSPDPTVAGLSSRMLERGNAAGGGVAEPAEPAGSWVRIVDIAFGDDSNVALVDDSILPSGETNSSAFAEVIAYGSGSPGAAEQWRLDLSGYFVRYADAPAFDQSALSGAAMRGWRAGAWQLEAGPRLLRSTLDSDGFEQRLGVAVGARRSLGSRTRLEFRAGYDDVDDLDARYASIAGKRSDLRVRLRHGLGNGSVAASVELESNDRAAAAVSPDRTRLVIAYRRSVSQLWEIEGTFLNRRSEYAVAPVTRDETLRELTIGANRSFGSGWQLNARVQSADNNSSDPLYAYTRSRIGIGLSKLF